MVNFKNLEVWTKGFGIAVKAFHFVATIPSEEKYGLCRQITRAAVSIPSNIAEGSSRQSEREKARFIEIALGSAFELESQLLISQSINYGDCALRNDLLTEITEEQKMLASFRKKFDQ